MKNRENTLKSHENQPDTMKNHENVLGNQENQPKIMRKNYNNEKHRQRLLSPNKPIRSDVNVGLKNIGSA